MTKKPTIADAITALGFDGGFKIIDGKIAKWYREEEQPLEEAIQAKLTELQAEYDSIQYQRDRLLEYPSIQECIHAILDNDLESLQAKRAEVKAKYSKPT